MGIDTDRSGSWSRAAATVLVAVTLLACTQAQPRPPARPQPVAAGSDEGTIALAVTDAGLAGVPLGESEPRWVVPDAVAAPDGSAAFTAAPTSKKGTFEVARLDLATGAGKAIGTVEGPAGLHVAAVAPEGAVLALAGPEGDATRVTEFHTLRRKAGRSWAYEGTVEPEAFSIDRNLLFAARIYGDRYHVHGLDLTSGEQWPTSGPDKLASPEDMYGSVVQAALSPDGRQLATLYRDEVSPDHSAFVHLLALDGGLTVCVDLHEPFGTGKPGSESIIWRDDGRVAVGHWADEPGGSAIAMFDPQKIWTGPFQEHYHADQFPDAAPPAVPYGVADTPGFRRFVALAR